MVKRDDEGNKVFAEPDVQFPKQDGKVAKEDGDQHKETELTSGK